MPFFIGSGGNSVIAVPDNLIFNPGAIITGNVFVQVTTSTDFSGVFLKLSGKETVRWVEETTVYRKQTERVLRNGNWESRAVTTAVRVPVTHLGKHIIFKAECMIMQGGTLLQGQYTIPFSFQLPNGIPGSFSLSGISRSHPYSCDVGYSIKAIVRVPGLLKSNLRHVTPISVIQPPPQFSTAIVASTRSNISLLCCIPRGYADLSFRCEKDAFYTGESVEVVASAVNNSKSSIKRLAIKLRRTIELRSNTGGFLFLEETISEQFGPAVQSRTGVENLPMKLQIPFGTPQQCFGSIIRCLYSVRLAGKVRWGTDAKCTVPAFIYDAYSERVPEMVFGSTWQPTVLPPVNLTLSTPLSIPSPITIDAYADSHGLQPSAPPCDVSNM